MTSPAQSWRKVTKIKSSAADTGVTQDKFPNFPLLPHSNNYHKRSIRRISIGK
jgi:hypothetical protein